MTDISKRTSYTSEQRNHLVCIRNEMKSCRNIRSKDTTLQTLHMPTNVGLALQHSPIVHLVLFRSVLVGANDVSLEGLQKSSLRATSRLGCNNLPAIKIKSISAKLTLRLYTGNKLSKNRTIEFKKTAERSEEHIL